MNNSCIWTTSLSDVTKSLTFITYAAVAPIFFILGMIGHTVALIAFHRQRKTEAAYAYQVFVTVVKTVEIVLFDLWLLFFVHFADQDWTGQKGDGGWIWFKQNYFLMWFTARIIPILQSISITFPVLATAAMTVDRILGLWKPILYKSMNKKRHHYVAFFSCFLISLLTSLDSSFRWAVSETDTGYKIISTPYGKTITGLSAGHTRNGVRVVTEFVMIFCSVAMIVLYKNYAHRVQTTMCQNNAREAAMKANQRMMFTLAIFHTVSTAVPILLLTSYNAAFNMSVEFQKCDGILVAMVVDFIIQAVYAIDFYMLYLANGQFRGMVKKLMEKKPNGTVELQIVQLKIN